MSAQNAPLHECLDIYRRCYEAYVQKQLAPLKRRARASECHIELMSQCYKHAAETGVIHKIPTHDKLGEVNCADLKKLYKGQLAALRGACRDVYDEIYSSPPHGICPLCLQRVVSHIDHYLPQAHYPAFCVDPQNLVPTCSDCNIDKKERKLTSQSDRTVHPYFDKTPDVWLLCVLEQTKSLVGRFSVVEKASQDETTMHLLKSHLRILGLDKLYKIHAGKLLFQIGPHVRKLSEKGGPEMVRGYLRDELEDAERFSANSWQSALFRALLGSDWFCDGGFSMIES